MADKNFKERLHTIKAFVFDIDGVLTDGRIFIMENENMVRAMNIRDSYALEHAIKSGYVIGIISGGKSETVRQCLLKLGIHDIYLNTRDKLDVLKEFMHIHNFNFDNILYMGDDLPDYEVLKKVGIPCCPKDAVTEIKEISVYVSHKKGGHGCVRDVIEQTMKVQNKWTLK